MGEGYPRNPDNLSTTNSNDFTVLDLSLQIIKNNVYNST